MDQDKSIIKKPLELLQQVWGFDDFRNNQMEIIDLILSGKDVLALLPTGGGKSICFQIPAILKEGICIVISPLIALIKDQTTQLRKRGIKAMGLTGRYSMQELEQTLDNCIHGKFKFIYMSPERLQNDIVIEKLKQMHINLIAIDEAHCISQWGHDFRRSYLKCNLFKALFPKVSIIALSATATPRVSEEIIDILGIQNCSVVKKSFERTNINYQIICGFDKDLLLKAFFLKKDYPGMIYATSRNRTERISYFLTQQGVKATFFHGGLTTNDKEKILNMWQNGDLDVIVATNAFGMGIDKDNVRTIIHYDLPESLENYYQETGRAGRDGRPANAILLYDKKEDNKTCKNQFLGNLPNKKQIFSIYNYLNTYFQIAFGEGQHRVFQLDFLKFCTLYKVDKRLTYNALKILDRYSVISLSESFSISSKLRFIVSTHQLLNYAKNNNINNQIIYSLLRTYTGLFDSYINIDLKRMAKKIKLDKFQLEKRLQDMHNDGVIHFQKENANITLQFLVPREDKGTIYPLFKDIDSYTKQKIDRVNGMIQYAENTERCNIKLLLGYFGEYLAKDCGHCSVCLKLKMSKSNLEDLKDDILKHISKKPTSSIELVGTFGIDKQDFILKILTDLIDNRVIKTNALNQYCKI